MKLTLFLSVILTLFTATASLSQPLSQALSDRAIPPSATASKDLSIDDYGYIRDYGNLLGQIDSNGYVRETNGRIIGKLDNIGYVRDADDVIIGQFDSSGYIRDGDGRIVGQLDGDGTLRDANGGVITWGPIDQPLAAFLIFFQ